jgi:hypothetical protein
MKEWAISRAKEKGTWLGLITLTSSLLGYTIDAGVSSEVASLLSTIATVSVVNIVTKG